MQQKMTIDEKLRYFNEAISKIMSFKMKTKWTGRELNPRPLPCQGSDLPLIYQPEITAL